MPQPPARLGQLWSDYLERIRLQEWSDFQRAFRDYLAKGGPLSEEGGREMSLAGFDAYWVDAPIPAPGAPASGEIERGKLFSHSRGGISKPNLERTPSIPPSLLKQNPPN